MKSHKSHHSSKSQQKPRSSRSTRSSRSQRSSKHHRTHTADRRHRRENGKDKSGKQMRCHKCDSKYHLSDKCDQTDSDSHHTHLAFGNFYATLQAATPLSDHLLFSSDSSGSETIPNLVESSSDSERKAYASDSSSSEPDVEEIIDRTSQMIQELIEYVRQAPVIPVDLVEQKSNIHIPIYAASQTKVLSYSASRRRNRYASSTAVASGIAVEEIAPPPILSTDVLYSSSV